MKTRLVVVAAPSGAGKSSFVEKICREDSRLVDTVTYTTRAPRAGESEGHPYHFVSPEEFERKIREGFFVEWAQVHTNLYGTPLYQLEEAWKNNKCIIMDVDVQGFRSFKAKYADTRGVFILPPSIDELRRRIIKRDGKTPADIEIRMVNAEREMLQAKDFDVQIVNDNFEESFQKFKKVLDEWLGSG